MIQSETHQIRYESLRYVADLDELYRTPASQRRIRKLESLYETLNESEVTFKITYRTLWFSSKKQETIESTKESNESNEEDIIKEIQHRDLQQQLFNFLKELYEEIVHISPETQAAQDELVISYEDYKESIVSTYCAMEGCASCAIWNNIYLKPHNLIQKNIFLQQILDKQATPSQTQEYYARYVSGDDIVHCSDGTILTEITRKFHRSVDHDKTLEKEITIVISEEHVNPLYSDIFNDYKTKMKIYKNYRKHVAPYCLIDGCESCNMWKQYFLGSNSKREHNVLMEQFFDKEATLEQKIFYYSGDMARVDCLEGTLTEFTHSYKNYSDDDDDDDEKKVRPIRTLSEESLTKSFTFVICEKHVKPLDSDLIDYDTKIKNFEIYKKKIASYCIIEGCASCKMWEKHYLDPFSIVGHNILMQQFFDKEATPSQKLLYISSDKDIVNCTEGILRVFPIYRFFFNDTENNEPVMEEPRKIIILEEHINGLNKTTL